MRKTTFEKQKITGCEVFACPGHRAKEKSNWGLNQACLLWMASWAWVNFQVPLPAWCLALPVWPQGLWTCCVPLPGSPFPLLLPCLETFFCYLKWVQAHNRGERNICGMNKWRSEWINEQMCSFKTPPQQAQGARPVDPHSCGQSRAQDIEGRVARAATPPAQGHPARDRQNQDLDLDLTSSSCVPPTAPRYCKPISCLTSPVFQYRLKAAEDASSA